MSHGVLDCEEVENTMNCQQPLQAYISVNVLLLNYKVQNEAR